MREIKFRAWDKKNKKWFGKEFRILPDGRIEEGYPNISTWKYHTSETLELSQFTGLLDKNGNEIYEGDILDIDGYKGFVEWENDIFNGFIFFKRLSKREMYGYLCEYKSSSTKEVIGNIYENKELLNDRRK